MTILNTFPFNSAEQIERPTGSSATDQTGGNFDAFLIFPAGSQPPSNQLTEKDALEESEAIPTNDTELAVQQTINPLLPSDGTGLANLPVRPDLLNLKTKPSAIVCTITLPNGKNPRVGQQAETKTEIKGQLPAHITNQPQDALTQADLKDVSVNVSDVTPQALKDKEIKRTSKSSLDTHFDIVAPEDVQLAIKVKEIPSSPLATTNGSLESIEQRSVKTAADPKNSKLVVPGLEQNPLEFVSVKIKGAVAPDASVATGVSSGSYSALFPAKGIELSPPRLRVSLTEVRNVLSGPEENVSAPVTTTSVAQVAEKLESSADRLDSQETQLLTTQSSGGIDIESDAQTETTIAFEQPTKEKHKPDAQAKVITGVESVDDKFPTVRSALKHAANSFTQDHSLSERVKVDLSAAENEKNRIDEFKGLIPTALNRSPASTEVRNSSATERTHVLRQVETEVLRLASDMKFDKEGSFLKFRLDPADLGSVEITLVRHESGSMSAHLVTDSESARHTLHENVAELRTSLEDSGLQLQALDISCRSFSPTGQGDSQGRHTQNDTAQYQPALGSDSGGISEGKDDSELRLLNLRA